MIIGGYGPLIFGVSLGAGNMMESLNKTLKVRWAEKEIMLSKSNLEFTGFDADEATFSMLYVEGWTDSPRVALPLIESLAMFPIPYPLIIGGLPVSSWSLTYVISEIRSIWKKVNGQGAVSVMQINVTMKEYTSNPFSAALAMGAMALGR